MNYNIAWLIWCSDNSICCFEFLLWLIQGNIYNVAVLLSSLTSCAYVAVMSSGCDLPRSLNKYHYKCVQNSSNIVLDHVEASVQDGSTSGANVLETPQSCTKPSMYTSFYSKEYVINPLRPRDASPIFFIIGSGKFCGIILKLTVTNDSLVVCSEIALWGATEPDKPLPEPILTQIYDAIWHH